MEVIKDSYKLYQGDCLEVMDELIKDDVKVDMILTDPPYGIDLTPQRENGKFKNTKVINDNNLCWLPKFVNQIYALTKNTAIIFCAWQNIDKFKIELEKNENYWDKDSVKLDKVNYQIVSDQTARFNSFDSGSLDYVACADKEWIGRFDKKDKVDVVEAPIPTVRYDFFNCQDKIFSNVNIRKAFTMAVNREDMCSVIYNDIHKPLYGWVPYSTSTGELGEYRDQVEEPLKSITEDPKELLLKGMQELGLGSDPSTLSITYTLSGTTEWTRTYATYCQQMWEKILGVKVELDFNEWGTFQSKTNNGEFQIAMMTWSIDYDDPMAMMEVFAGGSNMVPVFWQNEQYDSLVAQARKEMDEKTRVDLYKQAENILLADECVISPNVNECTHSYYYQYVKNYNKLASSTSGLKYVDTSAR